MAKSVIEVDWSELEKIRPLALKNGIKPTVQNLIDLALKVATDMYGSLDNVDFQNVCNLKK